MRGLGFVPAHRGVGPLAEPLGSSALDAGREPRYRQFECAAREVESGRVMACPGCGQVKLPKPPTGF